MMKQDWKVHPLIDNPLKSIVLIAVLFIIGFFTHHIFVAGLYLILYILFFFFAFMQYWMPTVYFMDDEGIKIKRVFLRFSIKWTNYKRVEFNDAGFFLSPYKNRNWLDRTRGIMIFCPPDIQKKVKSFVMEKIENGNE